MRLFSSFSSDFLYDQYFRMDQNSRRNGFSFRSIISRTSKKKTHRSHQLRHIESFFSRHSDSKKIVFSVSRKTGRDVFVFRLIYGTVLLPVLLTTIISHRPNLIIFCFQVMSIILSQCVKLILYSVETPKIVEIQGGS